MNEKMTAEQARDILSKLFPDKNICFHTDYWFMVDPSRNFCDSTVSILPGFNGEKCQQFTGRSDDFTDLVEQAKLAFLVSKEIAKMNANAASIVTGGELTK